MWLQPSLRNKNSYDAIIKKINCLFHNNTRLWDAYSNLYQINLGLMLIIHIISRLSSLRHIPALPVIFMTKRGNGYGTECESLKKVNGGRCIKARAQRHVDLHGVHRGGDIAVCTHHQGNGFVRQRHRAG